MAHEIQHEDKFGEVREHGQRAWHGLGVEIPDGLTAVAGFEQIGLDWRTKLMDLHTIYTDEQGKKRQFKVHSHKLHVREDTMTELAVVGAGYKPIQNTELAEFADHLTTVDRGVTLETAGSLYNGKIIFALVRLSKDINVTDADVLNQYVLIRNSHNGSSAFQRVPDIHPCGVRQHLAAVRPRLVPWHQVPAHRFHRRQDRARPSRPGLDF